jgi:hypothetical protein
MSTSTSTSTSTSASREENAQVKAHYDQLLGKTYTWYVRTVCGVYRVRKCICGVLHICVQSVAN